MTTVLVDTHVLQWWSAEPERIVPSATAILSLVTKDRGLLDHPSRRPAAVW